MPRRLPRPLPRPTNTTNLTAYTESRTLPWVVEACHSWLNRNRSLLIRWSKKPQNHLALLQLASGLIAFRKANAYRVAVAQSR
jgi:hypothetical protein